MSRPGKKGVPRRDWERFLRVFRETLPRTTALEIAEVLAYVKTAALRVTFAPYIYPAIGFCAYTGARRSEMFRALVDDVNGRVLLREKKRSQNHAVTPGYPKGVSQLFIIESEELTGHQGHDVDPPCIGIPPKFGEGGIDCTLCLRKRRPAIRQTIRIRAFVSHPHLGQFVFRGDDSPTRRQRSSPFWAPTGMLSITGNKPCFNLRSRLSRILKTLSPGLI